MDINVQEILRIAKKAGEVIMEVYGGDFIVEEKEDRSPLTEADVKANEVICQALQTKWPEVPILSEENQMVDYEIRKNWDYFWLVDPLDGTKEFVKKNGEFTVNIALIKHQQPILGVVVAPALGVSYWAKSGEGAFREKDSAVEQLPCESKKAGVIRVVSSRSHMSEETKKFIDGLNGKIDMVHMGSSLKLCLVAEGSADIYPRFAPTMEWDTAAAQAIVEEVGKTVIAWDGRKALLYNKPDLHNPWFVVS